MNHLLAALGAVTWPWAACCNCALQEAEGVVMRYVLRSWSSGPEALCLALCYNRVHALQGLQGCNGLVWHILSLPHAELKEGCSRNALQFCRALEGSEKVEWRTTCTGTTT